MYAYDSLNPNIVLTKLSAFLLITLTLVSIFGLIASIFWSHLWFFLIFSNIFNSIKKKEEKKKKKAPKHRINLSRVCSIRYIFIIYRSHLINY